MLTLGIALFLMAAPAHAATVNYYVRTDGNDSNDGSANDADNAWLTIENAVDNVANPTTDTIIINVAAGTYATGNNEINIDRDFTDLTIQGADATTTIVVPHETAASATTRVFVIGNSETVTLSDLTIKDGFTSSADGAGLNFGTSGTLTMTNCIVDDNDSSGNFNSAGIYTRSPLIMDNCTVSNNNGGYVGGLDLSHSTGVSFVTNSTFMDNTAVYPDNIGVGYQTNAVFTNNTILGANTFDKGIGDYNSSHGEVYMQNNIVWESTLDFDNASNVYGSNNIVYSQVSSYFTDETDGNLVGTDITVNLSDTLASNGTVNGSTTLALSDGSEAINAGNSSAHGPSGNQKTPPNEDQRGFPRVSTLDIGAYEYGSSLDVTDPAVDTYSPADGATGVSLDANLVLTFAEAVDAESGNITLYKGDGTEIEQFDVTADISGTGTTTITIDPASDFDSETDYYVQIDATAFDDPSSNSYVGISDSTTWNFTSADVTDPIVSTLSPTDGATGVAVSANLVLTFTEAVDVESGNITIKNASDDSTVETIVVTSDAVSGSGSSTITVNPTTDFANGTVYYVQIDATAFDDTSGNSYAGVNDSTTWNFTTVAASIEDEEESSEEDDSESDEGSSDDEEESNEDDSDDDDGSTKKKDKDDSDDDEETTESSDEDTTETETVEESCNYTVVAGDTLWDIAEAELGDGALYTELIDLNVATYSTIAQAIEIGWVLALPCDADSSTDTSTGSGSGGTPVVSSGTVSPNTRVSPQEERNAEDTTEEEQEVVDSDITKEDGAATDEELPIIHKTYDVTILVTDPEGNPVPNTDVELHSEPRYATTDADGRATFTDVEPGEHTLYVAYNDYTAQQPLYVAGYEEVFAVAVTMELQPENSSLPTWLWLAIIAGIVTVFGFLFYRKNAKNTGQIR